MNFKQKLCYTILGATILLVGILTANLLSPIVAQNNTFDEITCRRLNITNDSGKPVLLLWANDNSGVINIMETDETGTMFGVDSKSLSFIEKGKLAISLTSGLSGEFDNARQLKFYKADGSKTSFFVVGDAHSATIGVVGNTGEVYNFPSWADLLED